MKRKILIILLLIIVLAIISVTIIYITNRNNIKIGELYGTWTLEENKTILYGKEIINAIPFKCVIELQEDNKMKLCYYDYDELKCETVDYTYKSNILNIKDNDWYLKGKYYIFLENNNNTLVLKQTISSEEQAVIYYKRS